MRCCTLRALLSQRLSIALGCRKARFDRLTLPMAQPEHEEGKSNFLEATAKGGRSVSFDEKNVKWTSRLALGNEG